MPAKMPPTYTDVTEPRLYQRDQSWCYQVERRHTKSGKVVRVSIRRNAYDGQSYKRALVYDTHSSEWKDLVDLVLDTSDSCYRVSYTTANLTTVQRQTFVADAARVFVTASVILDATC